MANKHRGEVAATIAGQEVTLRPSWEAIAEIEERLGMGLVPLARRFVAPTTFGMRDVVTILHACATAGGAKLTVDQIGQAVAEAGLTKFSGKASSLVWGALAGGKDPEGNAEAAPAETSSTGAA